MKLFFEKVTIIDKPKDTVEREDTITNIRNERDDITTDSTDSKKKQILRPTLGQ